MALVTAAVEDKVMFRAFSHHLVPLIISPKMSLQEVIQRTSRLDFGGTDCALPMITALQEGLEIDAFIVYTDSETWANPEIHPIQALWEYRRKTGINAKLVVVGMVSNGFTIADPNDPGMLDVVGFDTSAPQVMSDFIRGVI
jgi:60 kDa SS-A/Ro ribonucleoprotein